jgi:hypothetical protein
MGGWMPVLTLCVDTQDWLDELLILSSDALCKGIPSCGVFEYVLSLSNLISGVVLYLKTAPGHFITNYVIMICIRATTLRTWQYPTSSFGDLHEGLNVHA